SEWILPLLFHYFMMLVPGILGLAIGWVYKDKFIHDDETYPFPSIIQTNISIDVLSTEAKTKGPLFLRYTIIGFLFALLTVPLFYLDFSSISKGILIGLFLGPIGVALFSAGVVIGKPKLTFTVSISSLIAYTLISSVIIGGLSSGTFMDYFTYAVQKYYLSPAIGIVIGGLILGPMVFSIVKSLIKKKEESNDTINQTSEDLHLKNAKLDDNNSQETQEQNLDELIKQSPSLKSLLSKNRKLILLLGTIHLLVSYLIISLNILNSSIIMIFMLVFWILVIGGLVNAYLMVVGYAKSSSIIVPPFIFDLFPIYLTGASGYLSYLAVPTSESDGSVGIVSSQKLAKLNEIPSKTAFMSYLAGYLTSTITTPLFALLLWFSFGIGTDKLPAPAFPVNGALVSAFASRSVTSVLSLNWLFIGLIFGMVFALFDADIVLGIVLGLFFPPHMALALSLGGITRYLYDRKVGKEIGKDRGSTIATALGVGGSFVIPILIILVLL
ncbi:MAG: OPT/YSL family transporter, partial [Candidatus Heimdallarchaeota archaeon]|nr:OPT/YSL family transporter [Candidatus Heimdallarchaeota archaeon]